MGKKMMILGASPLQVPAIRAAKELGYEIILVDYDEEAVGFPLADVKLVVSTLDMEEVYRQALIYRPDVVITSTSDGPVRTAAYVNEKLGKRPDLSYEDSLCATVKSYMRGRLKENHVPIPAYYVAEDFASFRAAVEALGGRCMVKPSDNAGSRGVTLLEGGEKSKDELWEVYEFSKSNSRNGVVMVEEVMDGPEVSVEAMTVDGETSIIAITDKYITPPPYFVEIAHCEPSQLSERQKEEIKAVALQAIRAIRLQNGPSHTEIKVTADGAKIVEIAARLGGDFITSKLVPLSTGVDLVGASVLLATGKEPDLDKKRQKGAAIHFIFADNEPNTMAAGDGSSQNRERKIKRLEAREEIFRLTGVEEVVMYKKAGDIVRGTRSSNDRLGHIITVGETAKEAMETGKKAMSYIHVEYEEGENG